MGTLEYLLPETMDEALELLEQGIPLAGGTTITPLRKELTKVVDLRKLDLGGISVDSQVVEIGATTKLQSIVEAVDSLPYTLCETCKLESGWNLRNMATLGGVIMSGDGRSPLLTVLTALEAQVFQAPGKTAILLPELLDRRKDVKLITHVRFETPSILLYEQVARAPADFPLVCVAIVKRSEEGMEIWKVTLGGYGSRPVTLGETRSKPGKGIDLDILAEEALAAYEDAGDVWASAAYRAQTASVLVKRLLGEVSSS